jgi:hypothetical protein
VTLPKKGQGPKIPNWALSIMERQLAIPRSFVQHAGLYVPRDVVPRWTAQYDTEQDEPEPPKEVPYEVNMVEALVGWKAWNFDLAEQTLKTRGYSWPKDAPFEAKCVEYRMGKEVAHCKLVPTEDHCCGIYSSTREDAKEFLDEDGILGMVYGWGRYIRGDVGWRAQFAYPKFFLIKNEQANLIEWLRLYHVPIYIEQPTLIYNPEEDGYEHRGTEEDWNSGATEESASAEEGSTSYEEGTGSGEE